MVISKSDRMKIYNKSNGHCWYCGCDLLVGKWHVDHFKPVCRDYKPVKIKKFNEFGTVPDEVENILNTKHMRYPGNDVIENMVPACAPCNLFKGVFSVEDFRFEITQQIIRARKTSVNFRTAERFGMLEITDKPVVFWFEENK